MKAKCQAGHNRLLVNMLLCDILLSSFMFKFCTIFHSLRAAGSSSPSWGKEGRTAEGGAILRVLYGLYAKEG